MSATRRIKLAIVVVNYGSSELLALNLAPVSSSMPNSITVVVDNYSSETERHAFALLAESQGWEQVLPAANTGFGIGMNLGVEAAISLDCTHFLLLNPDAVIGADAIAQLLERVLDDPLCMAAPRIVRPDGSLWFAGSDLYLNDGRIRSARRRSSEFGNDLESWLSGACLLLSRELWEIVGGFQADYFLYWEDVDLSHRVRAAGGTLTVVEQATAMHAEGGTQGAGHESSGNAKSDTYYYYNIRNRFVFAALNLSSEQVRAWRRHTIPIAWEVLMQGGRRQFLHSLRPLLAAVRGVRDGLAITRKELRDRSGRGSVTPATGGSK